jgi:hypothetical protein
MSDRPIVIRAEHYDIEEKRLMETTEVQIMALDVAAAIDGGAITEERFLDSFEFMQMANKQYHELSGDHGQHIGAVAAAVKGIIMKSSKAREALGITDH